VVNYQQKRVGGYLTERGKL